MGGAVVRLLACVLLLAMLVLAVVADNEGKQSPPSEGEKGYHSPPPPENDEGHHPPPPPENDEGHHPPPPPEKDYHTPPPPENDEGNHPPPPPKNQNYPPPPPKKQNHPPPPPENQNYPPPPSKKGNHPPPPPKQYLPPPPPKQYLPPPPPQNEYLSPPPPAKKYYAPPPPRSVKCKVKQYQACYDQEFTCPNYCPGGECVVDCKSCKPMCKCDIPGAVCQDPRFIGGDGITFYFHGKKDHDFCLISDSNVHINAHFIGRRNNDMHRDFTWVQSLGILFDSHRLYLGALKTSTWDNSVDRLLLTFDDKLISLPQSEGASWRSTTDTTTVSVTRTSSTNAVTIEVQDNFRITATVVPITEEESQVHNYGITKDDCFAHLELGFKFYTLSDDVHGVLGQTYRKDYTSKVKISAAMPVMGGVREFSSSDLFSIDCSVTRFHQGGLPITGVAIEHADMECRSGMTGRGIVCKK